MERFGIWNVRSLYETAAVKDLVNEIYKNKIYILAIQETRWKDSEEIRLKDYKIFYNRGDRHMFGVGFAVHKSWQDHVMQFQPINDRICTLRLRSSSTSA